MVMLSATADPFIIPVVGLILGTIMMLIEKIREYGKLVLYFGAQSFMNVYMSFLMRKSVVIPKDTTIEETGETIEKDLTGFPAGFALTALQQVISFLLFIVMLAGSQIIFLLTKDKNKTYTPEKLKDKFAYFCVIIFGFVFCMNIALNNFSLSLISIAVNLIIRSCLPLTTFLSQKGLSMCNLGDQKNKSAPISDQIWDVSLMCIGVTCAGVFTWASFEAKGNESEGKGGGSMLLMLGVLVCLLSLLCGSLNLAIAGVLGHSVKLNPLDTVAYMALPAIVFLLPFIFFLQKPIPGEWPKVFGKDTATDWEIFMGLLGLCADHPNAKKNLWLAILSGVLSFAYNIVQITIVHTLSAAATAFGGNFNKAVLILLSYMFMDPLPNGIWGKVIICAIIGNIASFSYYSYLQFKAKNKTKAKEEHEDKDAKEKGLAEESDNKLLG